MQVRTKDWETRRRIKDWRLDWLRRDGFPIGWVHDEAAPWGRIGPGSKSILPHSLTGRAKPVVEWLSPQGCWVWPSARHPPRAQMIPLSEFPSPKAIRSTNSIATGPFQRTWSCAPATRRGSSSPSLRKQRRRALVFYGDPAGLVAGDRGQGGVRDPCGRCRALWRHRRADGRRRSDPGGAGGAEQCPGDTRL